MYTKRDKDKNGNPLEFSKAVWFNFGIGEEVVDGSLVQAEHPQEVWVRFTYSPSETPRKVSFFKKSRICYTLQHLPPVLYEQYPLPIKAAFKGAQCPTTFWNTWVPKYILAPEKVQTVLYTHGHHQVLVILVTHQNEDN